MQLNTQAVDYAKSLIQDGKVVKDQKDNWSEDTTSTEEQNQFIDKNGIEEYAKWFLGIEGDKNNKTSYKFPFGDMQKVHRGAVIAAKVRAGQYKHQEIENAADELLQIIDNT